MSYNFSPWKDHFEGSSVCFQGPLSGLVCKGLSTPVKSEAWSLNLQLWEGKRCSAHETHLLVSGALCPDYALLRGVCSFVSTLAFVTCRGDWLYSSLDVQRILAMEDFQP